MSDTLTKASIRHEAMLHRDRIDPASEDRDLAARHFREALAPAPEQIVALYWPKGREFDCLPLLQDLLRDGVSCALPVVTKDTKILKFAAFADGDAVEPGPFDIMQPAITERTRWVEPDIFVVPLLAFDRHGNRLGYGGGYYDATLRHYRAIKPVVAVGYGYGQQAVLFNLPVDEHDQKMDWIVTPVQARRYG